MRDILFRGKCKDSGAWVKGFYFQKQNPQTESGTPIKHYISDLPPFATEVIPETVGQYTGLTDKNGKKIFEGDIIQFDYVGKNLGANGIETVIFENGKFGVKWGTHRDFVCLDGFANTTLEIIGNIHDNPELLKGV